MEFFINNFRIKKINSGVDDKSEVTSCGDVDNDADESFETSDEEDEEEDHEDDGSEGEGLVDLEDLGSFMQVSKKICLVFIFPLLNF